MNYFKQMMCKHEYKWHRISNKYGFSSLKGEKRALVCQKCCKVKPESICIAEYQGLGFR